MPQTTATFWRQYPCSRQVSHSTCDEAKEQELAPLLTSGRICAFNIVLHFADFGVPKTNEINIDFEHAVARCAAAGRQKSSDTYTRQNAGKSHDRRGTGERPVRTSMRPSGNRYFYIYTRVGQRSPHMLTHDKAMARSCFRKVVRWIVLSNGPFKDALYTFWVLPMADSIL